jgi:hypothetical protein
MGERNDLLWDVIVDNDDICFKHILPRLNQTDIKFLYDVNTETRALIKRSSRTGALKKKRFKMEKMSSISTLEFAWEHFPWGTTITYSDLLGDEVVELNETRFCYRVAQTNKLELLKWVREEKKCEWDATTIVAATRRNNMEMVKYCVANQCPIDANACSCAALFGHLELLKYLHEEVKAPWDSNTIADAADHGYLEIVKYCAENQCPIDASVCESAAYTFQLECLKYLHEEAKAPWDSQTAFVVSDNPDAIYILEYLVECGYDEYDTRACQAAAEYGHLHVLEYLHETAKAPWDAKAVRSAYYCNRSECLQYLLDNDCPLPEGWRYEGGVLHLPEVND